MNVIFFHLVRSIFKGDTLTQMNLLTTRTTRTTTTTKQQHNNSNNNNKKQTNKQTEESHFKTGLYSDIYGPISFRLAIIMETTKLDILLLVWMILTCDQGHSCPRKKITAHFLITFEIDLTVFCLLPESVG